MVSLTLQIVNIGKLIQETWAGVHNRELVTAGQNHVVVEAHQTVTLSWIHCSVVQNTEAKL